MKKEKFSKALLDELRKIPILTVACEKVGISRTTAYRWRTKEEYRRLIEEAMAEGEALVNDLSENQLLSLIKEKNWSAISFWLKHRNPKFRERVEVTAKFERKDELTPDQEKVVREALRIASASSEKIINLNKNKDEQRSNSSGDSGENAQG